MKHSSKYLQKNFTNFQRINRSEPHLKSDSIETDQRPDWNKRPPLIPNFDTQINYSDLASIKELRGKHDLLGFREALAFHDGSNNPDEKESDNAIDVRPIKKYMTQDQKTLEVLEKVIKNSGQSRSEQEFLLECLTKLPKKADESHEVIIDDINNYPEFQRQILEKGQNNDLISVGGPAAVDTTVFALTIPGIKEKIGNAIFITDSLLDSNIWHSAWQNHARHGNALNADESLSGHKILSKFLERYFFGSSLEEILKPDYLKIDLDLAKVNMRRLVIYLGNELNWAKQTILESIGMETEHDVSRQVSSLSTDLLHLLEKQTNRELTGNTGKSKAESISIHTCFTDHEIEEAIVENKKIYKGAGIISKRLTQEEIEEIYGENPNIKAAFKYLGDTHTKPTYHKQIEEVVRSKNGLWQENKLVTHILTDLDKNNKPKFVGLIIKDRKTEKSSFIKGGYLHFTGGYKVNFKFGQGIDQSIKNRLKDYFGVQNPLPNKIDTATGCSITAILKQNERTRKIIAKYKTLPQFATTNSHWTMVAHDDEHIIMRITGGGNIASREYMSSYFQNIMANTRRIFGDSLISIVSTYGCPRAVNAKNITETAKIADNFFITYGKGGTGNTKRHAEAISILTKLGFEKEVIDHLNQHVNEEGQKLGDLASILLKKQEWHGLFHDMTNRTGNRLGYDDKNEPPPSFSPGDTKKLYGDRNEDLWYNMFI